MSDTIVDLVAQRLAAQVAALQGLVQGVLDLSEGLAELLRRVNGNGAVVVPLGYRPAPGRTSTGVHRQEVTWTIGVILVATVADDATGRQSIGAVQQLIDATLLALAGWSPDAATWSPFDAGNGDLLSAEAGAVAFQASFTTTSELRVTP